MCPCGRGEKENRKGERDVPTAGWQDLYGKQQTELLCTTNFSSETQPSQHDTRPQARLATSRAPYRTSLDTCSIPFLPSLRPKAQPSFPTLGVHNRKGSRDNEDGGFYPFLIRYSSVRRQSIIRYVRERKQDFDGKWKTRETRNTTYILHFPSRRLPFPPDPPRFYFIPLKIRQRL